MSKKQVASSSTKSAQQTETRERAPVKGSDKAHVATASEQAAEIGTAAMTEGLADLTVAAELGDLSRVATAIGAVDATRTVNIEYSVAIGGGDERAGRHRGGAGEAGSDAGCRDAARLRRYCGAGPRDTLPE